MCARKSRYFILAFGDIIRPEQVYGSYESPIFMGQWAACSCRRHSLDDFLFSSQNVTKRWWGNNVMLHQGVCNGIITCGRAWTTVSSSALIPVAIFNSFNTVREREIEKESYREFNKTAQCGCMSTRRWSFQKKKNKKADNRQGSPLPPWFNSSLND